MGLQTESPPDANNSVLLSSSDNVLTACRSIEAGNPVVFSGQPFIAMQNIRPGHKVARFRIAKGAAVIKYGAQIGSATRAIEVGEHVHLHNMESNYLATFTRTTGSSSK